MRVARLLPLAGVLLAVVASVFVLFAPTYRGRTESSDGTVTEETSSALAVNGPGILVPIAIVLVLAIVAAWAPWRWLRWVAVALMGVFVVLGALSIGTFFLPAALCLLLALVMDTPVRTSASA